MCLVSESTRAQEAGDPIVIGRELTLFSQTLGEERKVLVRLPSLGDDEDARYPVLVLLDGNEWLFHQISAIVRHYEGFGRIPGLIVVGVPNVSPAGRLRNMTPSRLHNEEWVEGGGGADPFLTFISDELMPYIDDNFPTTSYRVLQGGSYGGLFTLHAMATRPDVFDGYLIFSPSVWWDEGAAVERVEELFQARDSLPIDVYVTLANESDAGMLARFGELITLLETRAPRGTSWQYEPLPDKLHETTYFESTYLGLDALFSDWRFTPDLIPQGLAGLEVFLASRSEKYGTKMRVPGMTWLGPDFLPRDRMEAALTFLNGAIDRESEDPLAYGWLAAMFEDHNRLDEALANYEIAHRLAEETEHESAPHYLERVTHLERLVGRR